MEIPLGVVLCNERGSLGSIFRFWNWHVLSEVGVESSPQPNGIYKSTLRMGKSCVRVSCVRQPCEKVKVCLLSLPHSAHFSS